MLKLHNLAEAYGHRPSQIIGIPDEWAAYQFDSACLVVGRIVERALNENATKKESQRLPREEVIRQALGEPPPGEQAPTKLPIGAGVRVVKQGDPEYELLAGKKD